jgi:hypothetical protein
VFLSIRPAIHPGRKPAVQRLSEECGLPQPHGLCKNPAALGQPAGTGHKTLFYANAAETMRTTFVSQR